MCLYPFQNIRVQEQGKESIEMCIDMSSCICSRLPQVVQHLTSDNKGDDIDVASKVVAVVVALMIVKTKN